MKIDELRQFLAKGQKSPEQEKKRKENGKSLYRNMKCSTDGFKYLPFRKYTKSSH